MELDKYVHWTEWLLGALFSVLIGLKYSVSMDIVNSIFTAGSTPEQVFGLVAFLIGGASLYRLVKNVLNEL